jgi:hypothetical protein
MFDLRRLFIMGNEKRQGAGAQPLFREISRFARPIRALFQDAKKVHGDDGDDRNSEEPERNVAKHGASFVRR